MSLLPTVVLLSILGAFIVTFLVTPFIIRRMHLRKLVGKDMNKLEKPLVAEMGGISVLFGFSFGMTIAIAVLTYLNGIEVNLAALLASFCTIILIGFLGIVDDLIGWKNGIRQWQHALFPIFAALPLMAVKVGVTSITVPFMGAVSLGLFYSLVLVPLGVTGAANAFNMLAGFNGLEAGLGAIISFTLLVISWIHGSIEAVIISAAMLGALVAFLKFNWIPAKIFPGDSLTLMIGASIAVTVIVGNMEKVGVMLLAIYFVELVFKARHKFQSECFGVPQKNGTLKPRPEGGSLTQWVMRRGSFTEKQVVYIIFGMQAMVSMAVFLLFFFRQIY